MPSSAIPYLTGRRVGADLFRPEPFNGWEAMIEKTTITDF